MTSINYVGYHGTDSKCVASIQSDNFRPSLNPNDWLGYGVYFFVDGIGCPVENACEWAINQAYHKGKYLYNKYSVLETPIQCGNVLDVTTTTGLNEFNTIRNLLIQKQNKLFPYRRDFIEDDRIMWNAVAEVHELDGVVHNLYIKDAIQRKKKIASNVANTTVICVKDKKSIDYKKIDIVKSGGVTNDK